MRLSPLDTELFRMQAGLAVAHLFMLQFDTAASWAEKALPEARRALAKVCALNPALRMSAIGEWLPIQAPDNLAVLMDGLRKAGLPE